MKPANEALLEGLKELLTRWETQLSTLNWSPTQQVVLQNNIRKLRELIRDFGGSK